MARYVPLNVSVVVTGTAESVRQELTGTAAGVPDRFCALVPGEVAWDNCQCGQFAQTIESVFGSNSFPTPATDTRQTPCGPNLTVVVVRASLVRCVHGVSDDGRPPSCAALLADALFR